jgi:hypothetical protein
MAAKAFYRCIAPMVEFASDNTEGIKIFRGKQYIEMEDEDKTLMGDGVPTLYKNGAQDLKLDRLDNQVTTNMRFPEETMVQAHCMLSPLLWKLLRTTSHILF